jgi:hypothetical protein
VWLRKDKSYNDENSLLLFYKRSSLHEKTIFSFFLLSSPSEYKSYMVNVREV